MTTDRTALLAKMKSPPRARGVSEAGRRERDREVIRALVRMRAPALIELAKH